MQGVQGQGGGDCREAARAVEAKGRVPSGVRGKVSSNEGSERGEQANTTSAVSVGATMPGEVQRTSKEGR